MKFSNGCLIALGVVFASVVIVGVLLNLWMLSEVRTALVELKPLLATAAAPTAVTLAMVPTLDPTATNVPIPPTAVVTMVPPTVEAMPTLIVLPTQTLLPAEPVQLVAVPLPAPTQFAKTATANRAAEVYQGPGTNFMVVGTVTAGQIVTIVEASAQGDWYKLAEGGWIGAYIVDSLISVAALPTPTIVPLPTATETSTPVLSPAEAPTVAPGPTQPLAATQIPVMVVPTVTVGVAPSAIQPFVCKNGCATAPDPSCNIKGNVNSDGERIYHTIDSQYYERTDIKPEEGDVWFCTSQEAIDAGFRAPQN